EDEQEEEEVRQDRRRKEVVFLGWLSDPGTSRRQPTHYPPFHPILPAVDESPQTLYALDLRIPGPDRGIGSNAPFVFSAAYAGRRARRTRSLCAPREMLFRP